MQAAPASMPAFGSIAQTCNLQVKFEVSTIVFRVRKEVCSSLPGLGFLCSGAELPLLHAHQMLWPGHSHWRCSGCIYACVRAILHTEGGSSHAREVNKGRRQRTVLAGGGHVGIPPKHRRIDSMRLPRCVQPPSSPPLRLWPLNPSTPSRLAAHDEGACSARQAGGSGPASHGCARRRGRPAGQAPPSQPAALGGGRAVSAESCFARLSISQTLLPASRRSWGPPLGAAPSTAAHSNPAGQVLCLSCPLWV